MTTETPPVRRVIPPRAQQLIILALGLALASLWAWRAGLLWPPSPPSSQPQAKYFIEITGDLPRPGIHMFPAPPTLQEVWQAAGGRGEMGAAVQPLPNGAKITVAPDRTVSLGRMSGNDLLTLGLALDPNQATTADLEAIPGFGPVLARRLVEHRETRGAFQNLEDLLQIKGMGPKNLEKIRPYMVIIETGQENADEK